MQPVKEEKSWVLRAAAVLIPVVLVVLGIWLWPWLQQAYRLPDTAVPTYLHALSHTVPPGTGRVTRTNVIEAALAGTLGQLTDIAGAEQASRLEQLLRILHFNAQMGQWAAGAMTVPAATRVAMFRWGMRPRNLKIINHVFSRWSTDRVKAVWQLKAISGTEADNLLAHLLRDPVPMVHLSVMAVLWTRRPTPAECGILRHWIGDKEPYGCGKPRTWRMFLFGSDMVNAKPKMYRLNTQRNLNLARQFANSVLTHWRISSTPDTTTRTDSAAAASRPAFSIRGDNPQADQAQIRARMDAVSEVMRNFYQNRATTEQVDAALAAQMRTIIRVTTLLPWQRQLSEIMSFNAAMSRWIDHVSRLSSYERRTLLNWVRFRAQNVELMHLAMSRRLSRRMRTVPIAPKLHGVERTWLIHHLLSDQRVCVELAMLDTLWKMPIYYPSLVTPIWNWAVMEPLPKGRNGTGLQHVIINGHAYAVSRIVSTSRYRQARDIGGRLLSRWNSDRLDPLITQLCRRRAERRISFGVGGDPEGKHKVRGMRIVRELFELRQPPAAIPFLLRIIHEPVLRHTTTANSYVSNRSAALWMLLVAAKEDPLKYGFIKDHWPSIASPQMEIQAITQITAWWQSHGVK